MGYTVEVAVSGAEDLSAPGQAGLALARGPSASPASTSLCIHAARSKALLGFAGGYRVILQRMEHHAMIVSARGHSQTLPLVFIASASVDVELLKVSVCIALSSGNPV